MESIPGLFNFYARQCVTKNYPKFATYNEWHIFYEQLINHTPLPEKLAKIRIYECVKYVYEGHSKCNEIVPINQKVLYLYALQLHSQKYLLPGYTTAKSQLSSSFPTLHNPLSRKGTKLHCDTNLSSVLKFRILYEPSVFSVCLFVW